MIRLISAVLFFNAIYNSESATDCKPVKSSSHANCQCRYKEQLIDLHELLSSKKSPFVANGSMDNYRYSYQPCTAFDEGSCKGAASCQQSLDNKNDLYLIAKQPPPTQIGNFSGNVADNTLNITYSGNQNRTTTVMLRCAIDIPAHFTAFGEAQQLHYVLKLETNVVCPVTNIKKKGLSTGSILCITLLVVVVVYLFAGYAVMYKVKGARGFEAIPNYEFWSDLPGLIKDGFVFVSHGCKTATDRTYQQI